MILSTLINQYLAKDPEMADKLAEHEGKILKIELLGLNFVNPIFFVFIHHNSLSLSSKSALSPDTIIRGTPLNLLAVGLSKSNTIPQDVEIIGDILFVHSLKNIFASIDIDWTEIISKITGDNIAYAVNRFGAKLNLFKNKTAQNFNRDLREYLQEEYRFLVPRTEVEDFYNTIDNLRDDVERLSVRLKMLEMTPS